MAKKLLVIFVLTLFLILILQVIKTNIEFVDIASWVDLFNTQELQSIKRMEQARSEQIFSPSDIVNLIGIVCQTVVGLTGIFISYITVKNANKKD